MPWLYTSSSISGTVAVNGVDTQLIHNGLEPAPLNRGGTIDTDVFDWNPPTNQIGLKQGGLYWITGLVAWWADWGSAQAFVRVDNTGPPFPAFPAFEIIGSYFTQDANAPSTWGGAGHQQILLKYWGVWTVDQDAAGVEVKFFIQNRSGSDKTYIPADDPGNLCNLTIIRLSPDGSSNPPNFL